MARRPVDKTIFPLVETMCRRTARQNTLSNIWRWNIRDNQSGELQDSVSEKTKINFLKRQIAVNQSFAAPQILANEMNIGKNGNYW